jgi:hypothetical protein
MQQVDRELIPTLLPLLSQVLLSVYDANLYTRPYSMVALQPYLVLVVGGREAQVVVRFNDTILCSYSPLLMQEQLQGSCDILSFSVLCPP